jgi:hypothetical protein
MAHATVEGTGVRIFNAKAQRREERRPETSNLRHGSREGAKDAKRIDFNH